MLKKTIWFFDRVLNRLHRYFLISYYFIYVLFIKEDENGNYSFIIFSKDRAIQLECLLSSIQYYVKGNYVVNVIYNTSTVDHEISYKELMQQFVNVNFYDDGIGFKKQLVTTLKKSKGAKILFFVDDIVFKNSLNLNDLNSVAIKKNIFSLRMGLNLNYCYVAQMDQKLPLDLKRSGEFYQWNWGKAELDWNYPLSVDGHLFNYQEALFWAVNLKYKAPNSFESGMQIFRFMYLKKGGLCFQNSIIVNNPCNKVQTENDNFHGDFHQDTFLALWRDGYRIDYKNITGMLNRGVHEEFEYKMVKFN
ncbi:MAG: hypothetical protein K2Q03_09985 [Sphingobacteriaceae bacterium]|nr:hypothetical protein [Sphingobacteriaceae bacterium]